MSHRRLVRAGRLLSLVSVLRQESRITAAELARRLEVSERTVLRDLGELAGAGVPVVATRGPGGGFSLLPGHHPTLAEAVGPRAPAPRGGLRRMRVRITERGRQDAAVLGLLQRLRVREPASYDGWLVATCRLRSLSSAAVEVLALGPQVEVEEPAELRELVGRLAHETAALYRSSG